MQAVSCDVHRPGLHRPGTLVCGRRQTRGWLPAVSCGTHASCTIQQLRKVTQHPDLLQHDPSKPREVVELDKAVEKMAYGRVLPGTAPRHAVLARPTGA